MARARLDPKLMQKVAQKLRLAKNRVNVKISKKANRLGISSEAALAILAKELGIATGVYQRRLDPTIQSEIRMALPTIMPSPNIPPPRVNLRHKSGGTAVGNQRTALKAAAEYVIQDEELRSRCTDLLLGKKHFDRAVNQATLVLEDRLRHKAQPTARLVGENLAGHAINSDLVKTVLKVSDNQDEQRGISEIVRGIVPAFRNTTHHHLVDSFTREDALRVCGFIDVLLRIIDKSTKVR